jgi:multidrug efflux pump subunit AcrB
MPLMITNVIVPGGKFGAEPAPPGTEFTYTVRMPDRFNSVEAFKDIVMYEPIRRFAGKNWRYC